MTMKSLTLSVLLSFISTWSFAQKYCLTSDEVGVGGFDPVSYLASVNPVLGNPKISIKYDGVKYHFSSEANKNTFLGNPVKYLPQFGGWCSMNLVLGKATTPTYTNFLVQDGKVFLFERTLSVNGKELWLKDSRKNENIATMKYNDLKETGKANK